MQNLTVLVTDDHKIFRVGMMSTLKTIDCIETVLEAANGLIALDVIRRNPVQVVFMDIRMPEMNGIEATQLIKKEQPGIFVIAVSMFDDQDYVSEMFANGASAYLLKNTDADEIEEAIETVFAGDLYFSRDVSAPLLASLLIKSRAPQLVDGTYKLTKREEQILPLICEGLATKQIASQLSLSPRTIEGHRSRLLEKTKSRNVAELVSYAVRNSYFRGE